MSFGLKVHKGKGKVHDFSVFILVLKQHYFS